MRNPLSQRRKVAVAPKLAAHFPARFEPIQLLIASQQQQAAGGGGMTAAVHRVMSAGEQASFQVTTHSFGQR